MSPELLYLVVGATIWAVGLGGLLLVHHMLRRVIAVNLMGSGVFLVLVALAARSSPPDPVLQALVVTGLVVAISATAFAVRLASARAQHSSGTPEVERPGGDES
ncbi:NADH:quinone oxidoreductase [Proteobacteria bacterium 005FR1]|nr:NADH:quinone oxidoreductase [Proteobacteria bacterium 005FR1]